MKRSRKSIFCLLLTLFFTASIGMTSFADTTLTLSNTTISDTAEKTQETLAVQSSETAKQAEETAQHQSPETSEQTAQEQNSETVKQTEAATEEQASEETKQTEPAAEVKNPETAVLAASGGSYSLDFSAYDPRYYDFKLPGDYPVPPSGRASNPMPGAQGPTTLESLEPRDLALGQIVPYEVKIAVSGNTASEGGIINFTCLWDTITTNGSAFGFDPNYKVFAGFVDYGDPRNKDSGVLASVTNITSAMAGTNIKGTFEVSGLEDGDIIIVEMWVVLQPKLPNKIGGNVQARLESAQTAAGAAINTGDQTVPLNQTGKFTSVEAEVGIVKSDSPDPIYAGDTLTYSIKVTNNSTDTVANGIVVTDTLDPNVTFISASDGGTLSGELITWPAFALEPLKERVFTVTVRVNPDAPTDLYPGTSPHNGSATETRFNNADISNIVKFTMITADPNLSNNVWQEPTNVLPRVSVTAYKIWVGGPVSSHKPVELILYRQVGAGPREVVTGVTPTITPSTGPADKFTYTWTGLPRYNADSQEYIYTVDEAVVPDGYTKKIEGNIITNTYKPSLIISKVYGELPLQGAVFELYKGDSSGPTGSALKSITTGLDGKAVFEHLEDGTYWIVEAKPPTGYKWIDDIGPFIVKNGTITGPEGFIPAADGTTGNFIITVQNEPIRQLPATGGTGAIPFISGGFGLMVFAVYMKKRETTYDEENEG